MPSTHQSPTESTHESETNKETEKLWVVLPAGGSSQRFSAASKSNEENRHKLLEKLHGQSVLAWSLSAFAHDSRVIGVVIPAHLDVIDLLTEIVNDLNPQCPVLVVQGGKSRRESVYLGLKAIPVKLRSQWVGIHDAARPCFNNQWLSKAFDALSQHSWVGVLPGNPVNDTVKAVSEQKGGGAIEKTVDRRLLWQVQTPQIFAYDALVKAHESVPKSEPITDDAQLIEIAGLGIVGIIHGPARNIKITTPEDMAMAELTLQRFATVRNVPPKTANLVDF